MEDLQDIVEFCNCFLGLDSLVSVSAFEAMNELNGWNVTSRMRAQGSSVGNVDGSLSCFYMIS